MVALLKPMEHLSVVVRDMKMLPSKVGTVSSFIDSEGSICLIKIDGTAQCWGKDGDGQSSVPADFQ